MGGEDPLPPRPTIEMKDDARIELASVAEINVDFQSASMPYINFIIRFA
jgi:hypothetical protein